MLIFVYAIFLRKAERSCNREKMSHFDIFAAQLKLQPNFLKEVHYALVAQANFQKNSCARISNSKTKSCAISKGHFKHITNNPVSTAKYSNILSIKFTNIQVLRILIL